LQQYESTTKSDKNYDGPCEIRIIFDKFNNAYAMDEVMLFSSNTVRS